MSTKLHLSVVVHDPSTDKYIPCTFVTIIDRQPINIEFRKFTDDRVCGVLTNGDVGAKCIWDVFKDRSISLDHCAGRFDINKLHIDGVEDIGVERALEIANNCESSSHSEFGRYYYDDTYFGHTYFTVKQVHKLRKRLLKYINKFDYNDVSVYIRVAEHLKMIIDDGRNFARAVSVDTAIGYNQPDDRDIVILCAFTDQI